VKEALMVGERSRSTDTETILEARALAKTFALGFFRKRVHAVKEVSFSVRRAEVFGLIGPNGAGKTTTLKMLMGLVKPSAGEAKIFGEPVPHLASRRRVGYLPEISYYYDYLKPEEILDFYGRLYGLDAKTRHKRVDELIGRVGLDHARGKPLRKFSKGMLQRIGIAQALIADPELVVLDEPQSGLDPIGRKDVADLIASLRDQGKTVFFSSHILPDVERICDRVAVMMQGKIVDVGPLNKLLNPRTLYTEVTAGLLEEEHHTELTSAIPNLRVSTHPGGITLRLPGDTNVQEIIERLIRWGVAVESVTPRRENLEDVFVREAQRSQGESLP